jgi:dihydrodipicolinate synthase/N-acetylneuraminate lyase
MNRFQPGLVHTPVTPFTREARVDYDRYAKLIEFHLKHGAESLALPMHAGESVSLTDEERRKLLEFAIQQVKGRVPVIAHVSDSGTAIAAARAKHAEQAGAAAVVSAAPYYWTPPPAMLLEHFAIVGAAVKIPFYVYNAPDEMGGTKLTTDLALKLIARLANFAGIVDASLDWQFMIEVISEARKVRPDFQLVSGTEYLVSARAVGAKGMFSSLSAVAPQLLRGLYDHCREEKYHDARKAQEAIAAVRQVLKKDGVAGLKAALEAMGRDCGGPRYPLLPLGEAERVRVSEQLAAMAALRGEPKGW